MTLWNIEVSETMYDIMSDLFDVSGIPTPQQITSKEMQKVLFKMRNILKSSRQKSSYNALASFDHNMPQIKNISKALVISDISLIRYQMKVHLSNKDVDVRTVENLYNGLAEYIKKLPELVIVDITEKTDEVAKIVEEIKRVAARYRVNTSIIVLSSANKPKDTWACKYIEKVGKWQDRIDEEIKAKIPIAS